LMQGRPMTLLTLVILAAAFAFDVWWLAEA
jgi:hypothetical protein